MAQTNQTKNQNLGIADDEQIQRVIRDYSRQSEEEQASQYASELGLPYIDLNIFPISQEKINVFAESKAIQHQAIVISQIGKKTKVAVVNPENPALADYLKKLSLEFGYVFDLYVISQSSLQRGLKCYRNVKLVDVLDLMKMDLSGNDLKQFEEELQDLVNLEKRIKEIPTTQLLNVIIAGAMKLNASDIHFEPQKNDTIRLRYRIDGVLQTVAEFPLNVYPSIISRVKMLSGMMINVRDISQDGRFSIKTSQSREVDVRVSVLPGNFGESIVMRLLNQDLKDLQVDKLGLEGLAYDQLINQSEKKQGIIINSGPTGSGKTTTLYSIINKINTPDKKIITIEDPIEYQIPGISQTQVEPARGYTFANGLKAIVRQDPDVVLVGEIRDEETAEIAVHAALTGHLVLSTIHANSAAGVAPRLIDLGIKPSLITSAVNAFVAQRLPRRLCEHCKEEYLPAVETIDVIKKIISIISPKAQVEVPKNIKNLWRAKGCPKCKGLGYKGRVGVYEVLAVEGEVKEAIEKMSSSDEIMRAALENGMITIEQDGILKSLAGVTSLEEIQRAVGKGEYLIDLYEKIMVQVLSRGISIEKEVVQNLKQLIAEQNQLRDLMLKTSTKDLVKYVLAAGFMMRAGDIHLEPGAQEFKLRFRIDGVLQDVVSLPMNEYLSLLNEIKILCGFKTEARQGVIDSRFSVKIADVVSEIKSKSTDVRVSIILGGFGDIVVMRLLGQSADVAQLDKVGIHPVNLKKIRQEISKSNGIIFNTGPTGSGKTTTLYSILAEINKPGLKVITVEDPIEYQMGGIIQTQVNEAQGYNFSNALRALLRQNPDIMMIGEVRDKETAVIAYQAALTGHLVLSTLHTNSAAASVQRLVDFDLKISDVASGTNCFMAQRLVRRLCPHCKEKLVLSLEERKKIEAILNSISPAVGIDIPAISDIYTEKGCDECYGTGFKDRLPISEVLQMDEELEKFLSSNPTTSEIKAKAIEKGMLTMLQDGALRVLEGETTLQEVLRVA